jgi:hypothetical protein
MDAVSDYQYRTGMMRVSYPESASEHFKNG